MTKKKKSRFIRSLVLILLFGVAGFALYDLVITGVSDLLNKIRISNFYIQTIMLLVVILIIVCALGLKPKKAIKEIVD